MRRLTRVIDMLESSSLKGLREIWCKISRIQMKLTVVNIIIRLSQYIHLAEWYLITHHVGDSIFITEVKSKLI